MTKSSWTIALICAMGAGGFLTAHRVSAWSSDRELWRSAAEVAPELPRPHVNLCMAYGNDHELEQAYRECSTSVSLTFALHRNRFRQLTERASAQAAQAVIIGMLGHLDAADRMLHDVEVEVPTLSTLPKYRLAIDHMRSQ